MLSVDFKTRLWRGEDKVVEGWGGQACLLSGPGNAELSSTIPIACSCSFLEAAKPAKWRQLRSQATAGMEASPISGVPDGPLSCFAAP